MNWLKLPAVISASALYEQLSKAQAGNPSELPGKLVVADVRFRFPNISMKRHYLAGHIPGAIFVDLETQLSGEKDDSTGRHPFPSEDEFQETLSELGINFEDTVICYAGIDPAPAARFALMLRLSGVNAALLDGGLPAFEAEIARAGGQLQLEQGSRVLEPAEFTWQPFVNLVSLDEVAHASKSNSAVLVDARSKERYLGEVEPIDSRAGHIPSAVNVPYESLLDENGKFLAVEKLSEIFLSKGISKSRITFNYCGSGVSAAVNMLAMELAGFKQAYLYPGSYSQWASDPTRAVARGEA